MHKHIAAACLAALALGSAHAAEPALNTGFYVGGAVGGSRYSLADPGGPVASKDTTGTGFKLYGGWRFNENFGVEGGYARLGKFSERVRLGGAEVEQSGTGRAFYGAVTGRFPVSESFALNGRAGLAFGRVSGTNVLAAGANPIGSKRSLMVGLGVEYSLARNVALTADYDYFGKLSGNAKGGLWTVGLRTSF